MSINKKNGSHLLQPKIGFIGFGEAGSLIACGLSRGGQATVWAYDPQLSTLDTSGTRVHKARDAGVLVATSIEELVREADIVFSTVVARVAVDVAMLAAPFLNARHLYADLNSVSPTRKQRIADLVTITGARFAEGAIMTNVEKKQHRVPIFACGPAAADFKNAMNPLGMDIENLGPMLGRASATKMFRSIMVKGLEALFLECLLAAEQFGVGDKVLEKVQEGYPGLDWKSLANQLVGRTAEHGDRRADEMEEVATTLREMGLEPYMASAAAKRISSCGLGLKEHFADLAPKSYIDVIAVIRARAA